jgi:hypothetical protein
LLTTFNQHRWVRVVSNEEDADVGEAAAGS